MEMYSAGEMTVRNIVFPLQVDSERGYWHTTFQGSEISAESKALLRDALMTRTAKAAIKVRVPFTTTTETRSLAGTGKIARAVATGVHQGNGNVLIDWGDGKSVQDTRYSSVVNLCEMNDEEMAEWGRLRQESREANQALQEFERARRIDLREEVENKIRIKLENSSS